MTSHGGDSSSGEAPLLNQLRRLPPLRRKQYLVETLRQQFSEPLGLEPPQIGVRDNLLELGVDSLKGRGDRQRGQ